MNNEKSEIATLAGGCFWCTEAVFQRLKGVNKITVGYTGGTMKNPTYQDVCSGKTGHAEGIQIEFDPTIISYKTLLEVFFHLHDPTTLNRQGNDVGTQYRSSIFYHNEKQKKLGEEVKKQIEESKMYLGKIVTEIVPFKNFAKAEDCHQNYYTKNSYQSYCQYVIDPKITKLYKDFGSLVKPEAKNM